MLEDFAQDTKERHRVYMSSSSGRHCSLVSSISTLVSKVVSERRVYTCANRKRSFMLERCVQDAANRQLASPNRRRISVLSPVGDARFETFFAGKAQGQRCEYLERHSVLDRLARNAGYRWYCSVHPMVETSVSTQQTYRC